MTADERLALVRLKIERADKHIDDLKTAVRSFFDASPYRVSHKHDLYTRKLIYCVETVQPVPSAVAAIAGIPQRCSAGFRDLLPSSIATLRMDVALTRVPA